MSPPAGRDGCGAALPERLQGSRLLLSPLDYPFGIPGGSYCLVGRKVETLSGKRWQSGEDISFEAILAHFGCQRDRCDWQSPVALLACGSNASPSRLAEKLAMAGTSRAFGLRLSLTGWVPVYAATLSPYGAIPATFEHVAGEAAEPFLIVVEAAALADIVDSERASGNYGVYALNAASIRLETELPLISFGARSGAMRHGGELLRLCEFQPDASRGMTQREALASTLLELGMSLRLEDYSDALQEPGFVDSLRQTMIDRFRARPNLPGWGELYGDEWRDHVAPRGGKSA